MSVLWYHGTDSYLKYRSILKNGFKKGTYFTPGLDSAISMGGRYVFAIKSFSDSSYWEIISERHIPREEILYARIYWFRLTYLNKKATHAFSHDHLEGPPCPDCGGDGEHRPERFRWRYLKKPGGASFRTRRDRINVCETCHGFGYVKQGEADAK